MSKFGLVLAISYLFIALGLIARDGLFGESFIALILGLPWSLIFAYFEYFTVTGWLLFVLLMVPILLNAYLLYCLGKAITPHR